MRNAGRNAKRDEVAQTVQFRSEVGGLACDPRHAPIEGIENHGHENQPAAEQDVLGRVAAIELPQIIREVADVDGCRCRCLVRCFRRCHHPRGDHDGEKATGQIGQGKHRGEHSNRAYSGHRGGDR